MGLMDFQGCAALSALGHFWRTVPRPRKLSLGRLRKLRRASTALT